MDDDDDLSLARPAPAATWRDALDGWLAAVRGDGRARLGALVAAVVVLTGAAALGWWLLRPPAPPPTELSLPYAPGAGPSGAGEAPADGAATSTTAAPAELVVHAAGAVVAPGVHRLPAGARVADLLHAAGGPATDADLDRVNLAAPLVDGQRVWFPRIGEPIPAEVSGDTAAPGGTPAVGPAALVDLNTASVTELETLPGIGPTLAAAIVEHRERSGPFREVEDLLDVPGIGPARLAQLRDRVTV